MSDRKIVLRHLGLHILNDWGRRGYDDSVPGEVTKKNLPGIGLHDPVHGRQPCPEFNSFHQWVSKKVPSRGYFRAVSYQNGDTFVTSPPPPIVERFITAIICSRVWRFFAVLRLPFLFSKDGDFSTAWTCTADEADDTDNDYQCLLYFDLIAYRHVKQVKIGESPPW